VAGDLQRKGYVGKTIGIKLRYDDFKIVTRDQTWTTTPPTPKPSATPRASASSACRWSGACACWACERGVEAELMQPLGDFLDAAPLWRVPRLVLPAHAGLHLELPDRPDAAVPGGHHDPLLPQPRPDPGQQPPAVVDGAGGARHYVDKIVAGIADKRLNTPVQPHRTRCRGVRVITARAGRAF
jgi:hypothetical protein